MSKPQFIASIMLSLAALAAFVMLFEHANAARLDLAHHCTDPEATERVAEIAESCMREAEWAGQVRECERTARSVVCPLVPAYREPGHSPVPCSAARTEEQIEACR